MKNFGEIKYLLNRAVLVLLATLLLLLPKDGSADILCNVADPHDPTLNVRDSPGGTVVNYLQNERVVRIDKTRIDATGRTWAEVSGQSNADYRDWGWVFRNSLRCVDTDRFPRVKVSVAALEEAGIVPQDAIRTSRQPISCDEVPNGWGVTISRKLYENYRRRGFSNTALCFALGGWDVYFDPATGRPLSLYQLPGPYVGGPRPLWVPDCYKRIQITGRMMQGDIPWRPTGCTLHYHPSTGRPITKPELVELSSGGPAGGGVDEDNQSSTVSEDRLRSLVNGK